ncbi:MAG: hypothetical protein ACK5N8_06935 [Alphaproteobacteria bacterium]
MKKTGLTTFIYSFLLSLLTIFLADKVFFHPQKNDKDAEIKISNNNITLFLKDDTRVIASAKTEMVEREDLSKIASKSDIEEYAFLLDQEKEVYEDEEETDFSDNTLYAGNSDINDTSSLASEVSSNFIVLADNNSYREENNKSYTENLEKDEIVSHEEEKTKPVFSAEEVVKAVLLTELVQNENEVQKEKSSEFKIAQAEPEKADAPLSTLSDTSSDDDDFIPIQKNYAENSGRKINIKTKSDGNEVAMTKDGIPIESMTQKQEVTSNTTPDSAEQSSPWVVAKSRSDNSKFIPIEGMNVETDDHALKISKSLNIQPEKKSDEVKVADMVRNILIPIPDDIIQEGNVTPQLISSKKNKELRTKIEQNLSERRQDSELSIAPDPSEKKEEKNEEVKNIEAEKGDGKAKKTILDSLSSIFSSETPIIGITKLNEKEDESTRIYKHLSNKSKKDNKVTKILPTEIKLSFQPNRAEISGPTLRWIEAFANKVKEDKTAALEIRIDGTSAFELQQKRLRLLHNILTNKGVEYNKVNTVFTSREANSFIIRAVRIENKTVEKNNKEANNMAKIYQNW